MAFVINIIKRLLKWLLYLMLFIGVVVLVPNLPPYSKFSSIELTPTKPRVGPLAPNEILTNSEKLYVDKVLGPEAFQVYKGDLYTSLLSGEIVKISPGGHVTFVTKIGQPCTGLSQEHLCGRPLGFEIDEKTQQMYVVDAYYGVWKVDLKTDKKILLVSPRTKINGLQPKLLNSLALAKNGDLYVSDSSTEFELRDGAYTLMTDPTGRVLHYDAANNKSRVIMDNLWFSNGLIISPDNQFILVSETFGYRIHKHYINGPKKGKSEMFIDGLPGAPDNIRVLPDGSGVLVGLYTVFDDENPNLHHSLANTPILRKFLARFQRLIELPFEFLHSQYPHPVLEHIVDHIGHFKSLSTLTTDISGLFVIDWNGNIVASYYQRGGKYSGLSDAIVYNDKLYLGNPMPVNYIAAVPVPPLLKKAFAKSKAPGAPKVDAKSQAQVKEKVKVVEIKNTEKVKKAVPPVQQVKPAENIEVTTSKPVTTTPPPQTKPTQTPPTKPTEKPTQKPETKPTEKPQTKATEKPQTKPMEKPQTKPTEKPQTKATEKPQTKPTERPAVKLETKPTEQTQKKPTDKPQTQTGSVKPDPKTTETVKQTDAKSAGTKTPQKPESKQDTQAKPETKKTKSESKSPVKNENTAPPLKPITEEIPSDTIKPSKETLKVIKKDGPAEIPNPNL